MSRPFPSNPLTRRQATLLGLAALPSIAWAGAGKAKDRVDIATDKAAEEPSPEPEGTSELMAMVNGWRRFHNRFLKPSM